MGLHKSFDTDFILLNGAVLTTGGSLDLARGQVGIFDTENVTENGAVALSSFNGISKNKAIELRYREHDVTASRTTSTKTHKSFPFSLEDVLELRVSAPKRTEAQVDEVIVGYNGIDPETAMTFRKGEKKNMTVELSGEAIGMLGYPNAVVQIPLFFDAGELSLDSCVEDDPCLPTDCTPIIQNGLKIFKEFPLRGNTSVLDYIDVSPIRSCAEVVGVEKTYNYYTLTVCDTGDGSALGLIQQQYPGIKVERVERNGAMSTYRLMQISTLPAPTAYAQTLPSLIKGCEDCPAGYSEVEGGLLYAIALEDDGIDKTSAVELLANAVPGTGKKANAQDFGVGFYTVVLTAKPTKAQITTFLTTNPTATIDFAGDVAAICNNATVTTKAWVLGTSLKLTSKVFTLDLPDVNCDGLQNRLVELQAAYPGLLIELEGTTGGCQTRYKTSVETNMRGEVCSPIFLDAYEAEAPLPYDNRQWKPVVAAGTPPTDCLCGIRIKGKLMQVMPDECIIDEVGFSETSVKIRVAGGWISDMREGIGVIEDKPFNVEYITYAEGRTHLGGNLRQLERMSHVYHTGDVSSTNISNVQKFLTGVTSNLNYEAQYVDYAIVLRRSQFAQSMSQMHNAYTTYHIHAEVGRHQAVETLLNSLAAAAGVKGVQAFGS